MNTNHFKTIAFSTITGALGGALSGTLLGLAISVIVAIAGISNGEYDAVFAIPVLGMFGALYGIVGGIAAGFVGGAWLALRNAVANAPTVGKWFGAAIGALIAAGFPIGGALPVLNSEDWLILIIAIPAGLIGAIIGSLGGKVAGKMLLHLMVTSGDGSIKTIYI